MYVTNRFSNDKTGQIDVYNNHFLEYQVSQHTSHHRGLWEQGVDEKGKKGLELELGKGKGEAASIGYIDRLIDTLKR